MQLRSANSLKQWQLHVQPLQHCLCLPGFQLWSVLDRYTTSCLWNIDRGQSHPSHSHSMSESLSMCISPMQNYLCTWYISFVGGFCGVFCSCLVRFPCPKALTLKNYIISGLGLRLKGIVSIIVGFYNSQSHNVM